MIWAVVTFLAVGTLASLYFVAVDRGVKKERARQAQKSNEASREANRYKSRVNTDPEYRDRVRDEFENT